MKKIIIFSLIGISIVGFLGVMGYKNSIDHPFKGSGDTIRISANKSTLSGVLEDNKDSFKSNIAIKIYNKLNKVSISVKRGDYDFPKDMSLGDIIDSLESGKYNLSIRRVTIPEGYTIEQISSVLEKNEVVSAEEFKNACNDYELRSYIKKDSKRRYNLEGFLFPDTYLFEANMEPSKVIDMMIKRQMDIISEIEKEYGVEIKEGDLDRIITKASVIEREVSKSDEKSLVSSVIDNRLKKGMKLQIDATVLYALGSHKDRVLYKDLKVASPYNTYYMEGLPVGPISAPGKDSIVAAVFPESTKYLYYMTKDGTNHKFFDNYDDFLKYKNSSK